MEKNRSLKNAKNENVGEIGQGARVNGFIIDVKHPSPIGIDIFFKENSGWTKTNSSKQARGELFAKFKKTALKEADRHKLKKSLNTN